MNELCSLDDLGGFCDKGDEGIMGMGNLFAHAEKSLRAARFQKVGCYLTDAGYSPKRNRRF